MVRAAGADYFNPDEVARRMIAADPSLDTLEASEEAWQEGRRRLERAIGERQSYAFETTLGGNTIRRLLARAADAGIEVRMWYVGLESVEHHLRRVRSRVQKGGHDIPAAKIRERFDKAREHLVDLLPRLAELKVFDNSIEADPDAGLPPEPALVLHLEKGRVRHVSDLRSIPAWAKPVVAAALRPF